MTSKPIVSLWLLGEPSFQTMFVSLSPESARPLPSHALSDLRVESEARMYEITTNLSKTVNGAVLTYNATESMTPRLKSLLLMASQFVSELVVFLVGCNAIKTERTLDQIEVNLRKNLSEQGFDGDSATIVRVQKPEAADFSRLLSALDEKQLLLAPLTKRKDLPKDHPNADRAQLLLHTKRLLRTATLINWAKQCTAKELFALPISTQFGGMPYLPNDEDWPTCQLCKSKSKMKFLWQIDARAHLQPNLEGAGLLVFYYCDDRAHGSRFNNDNFTLKHYPDPKPENRQAIRKEAKAKFKDSSAPIQTWRINMESRVELPSVFELERYKKSYPGYWPLLDKVAPKTKQAEHVYPEMVETFGATGGMFASDKEGRGTVIGGYSDPYPYGTIPECDVCKKYMRSLIKIDSTAPNFPVMNMQFFICGCSLEKVAVVELVSADDRYDDDWE
jgi:uncharacterized protein YwqG